jgi:SseB protein N-terminal domain
VRELSAGDPRFRADQGDADPAVSGTLAGYAEGRSGEREVLSALAGTRLLVPVVAVGSPGGPSADATSAGEKASEVGVPAIIGRDGRPAVPAFTSLEALRRWQPSARPVPLPAASVFQSAVELSQAVIVDIAGPVPIAIEGSRLHALASGQPPPFLHEDPDVHAAVAAAAASQPPGVRIRLGPPPADADLLLELTPADPAAAVPAGLAEALAADIGTRLADRVRRGIAVSVQRAGAARGD